jgi:hypothetical protein
MRKRSTGAALAIVETANDGEAFWADRHLLDRVDVCRACKRASYGSRVSALGARSRTGARRIVARLQFSQRCHCTRPKGQRAFPWKTGSVGIARS